MMGVDGAVVLRMECSRGRHMDDSGNGMPSGNQINEIVAIQYTCSPAKHCRSIGEKTHD